MEAPTTQTAPHPTAAVEVSDALLECFANVADDANTHSLDDDGGKLLLAFAAPIARELLLRRRLASRNIAQIDPRTVLIFPGPV